MLRIRLRRVGKKGNPSYRIVVAESTSPRDGKYLEWIGNYDPMANPPAVTLKEDRASQWLSKGAQPSDAVARILDKAGILERAPLFRNTKTAATAEPAQLSPAAVTAVVTATPPAPVEEAPAEEAAVETTDVAAAEPIVDEGPDETSADEATVDEATGEDTVDEAAGEATVDEAAGEDTVEEAAGKESDEAAEE